MRDRPSEPRTHSRQPVLTAQPQPGPLFHPSRGSDTQATPSDSQSASRTFHNTLVVRSSLGCSLRNKALGLQTWDIIIYWHTNMFVCQPLDAKNRYHSILIVQRLWAPTALPTSKSDPLQTGLRAHTPDVHRRRYNFTQSTDVTIYLPSRCNLICTYIQTPCLHYSLIRNL